MFIKSYTNKCNNLVLRQKCTNNLYVENGILQKLRDCFLNTTRMLNILRTKFKYNIATYNLNEYKMTTKYFIETRRGSLKRSYKKFYKDLCKQI